MNAIEINDYSRTWRDIAGRIPKPEVIISISAHWYTKGTRIMNDEAPETIYDMYGFPKELYEVVYNPPGSPGVAKLQGADFKERNMTTPGELIMGHGRF